MTPQFLRRIIGSVSRIVKRRGDLTAITSSHSTGENCRREPRSNDALLTRMSMAPDVGGRGDHLLDLGGWRRSAPHMSERRSGLRCAPAICSASATAEHDIAAGFCEAFGGGQPKPWVEPVMSAVCPTRSVELDTTATVTKRLQGFSKEKAEGRKGRAAVVIFPSGTCNPKFFFGPSVSALDWARRPPRRARRSAARSSRCATGTDPSALPRERESPGEGHRRRA